MWLEAPSLDTTHSQDPLSLDPFSALPAIISNDHGDPLLQVPFPFLPDFLNLQNPFLDASGDLCGDVHDSQLGLAVCDNGVGDLKDGGGDCGGGHGVGVGNSWSFGVAITKAARSKRRIARKNSPSFLTRFVKSKTTMASASSKESSSKKKKRERKSATCKNLAIQDPSLSKSLRLILQKELKNSDVSSLGRIILPKKEAEANLPSLADKEGIRIKFKDIGSSQVWNLRYRFWPNNKSRMYVLENTGDFVKKHHLHSGDFILLFRDDETRQFFISARKSEEPMCSTYNWNGEEIHDDDKDGTASSDASSNRGRSKATVGDYTGDVRTKLARPPSHACEFGEGGDDLPVEDLVGSCSSLVSCIVDDLHDWNISSLERFDSFEDSDLSLYNKMLDMDGYHDMKKLG